MQLPKLNYNNHFKWGYGDAFYPWRRSPFDRWITQYGHPSSSIQNWSQENIRAARLIGEDSKRPVWLCFSGGIDSEVMVRTFLVARVPFRVVILQFENGENQHDVYWALRCCNDLQLQYDCLRLNVKKFLQSAAALAYADSTQCVAPEMLATMWLIDQLDGFVVLGSGECYLAREPQPNYVPGESPYLEKVPWYLHEKEIIASWYKHFLWRNRSGAPGFFQYTSEQVYAFIRDDYVQRLTANQVIGKLSTLSSKFWIYRRYWPKLQPRQKYTGYENLRENVRDLRTYLLARMPDIREVFKTPVETFLERG